MKTTKDVAEMVSAELDRVVNGDVRKDVIKGITDCTGVLIKLARLEMDFCWRNYEDRKPSIPWIANNLIESPKPEEPPKPKPLPAPKASTLRGQQIEKQIESVQEQLRDRATTPTLAKILNDKLKLLNQQLDLAEAGFDAGKDS